MDSLEELADEYRHATDRADDARARLHVAILKTLNQGVTQAEVARRTGYTRERLRQIARDDEALAARQKEQQ